MANIRPRISGGGGPCAAWWRGRACFSKAPPPLFEWSPSPAFAGEDYSACTTQPHPFGTVRRAPPRRGLDRVPARPGRHFETVALGAGPNGDPRVRPDPSARASDAQPHPCRNARCARCAVGDGGRRKMFRLVLCDRRDLGRPTSARFHRDTPARGRCRTVGSALLAGAARRFGESRRSANALAGCKRALPAQSARCPSSGFVRMGRGSVSRSRFAAGPLDHRL